MKTRLATVITLAALSWPTATLAAHVLGADAAKPTKTWVSGLKGLDVSSISIAQDTVQVSIAGGCVLSVHHPSQPPAMGETEAVGNTIVTWSKACDQVAAQAQALAQAGPLQLPWINLESGEAARPSAGRAAAIEARAAARKALDRNDLKRAQRALTPVLKR